MFIKTLIWNLQSYINSYEKLWAIFFFFGGGGGGGGLHFYVKFFCLWLLFKRLCWKDFLLSNHLKYGIRKGQRR